MKRLIVFLSLTCVAIVAVARPKTDSDGYRVDAYVGDDEFVLAPPWDRQAVASDWRYVLRYVHHDYTVEGLSFSLMVVKGPGRGEYTLALHDTGSPPLREMSFEAFDGMTEEQKLAVATAKRRIDQATAQALYAKWVRVLLRVRYGDNGRLSTGATYYYLSAYGFNIGHMNALATGHSKGKTTGQIVQLGLLLRQYALAKDGANAAKLLMELRTQAGKGE